MATDLLTLAEAACMLRLRVSTLRAWILRRRIAYVKVGRLVRVRRVDVERVISAGIVPAAHAGLNHDKSEFSPGVARG